MTVRQKQDEARHKRAVLRPQSSDGTDGNLPRTVIDTNKRFSTQLAAAQKHTRLPASREAETNRC